MTCMKNTIMVLFYCICPCDNFVQNKCLIISCSKHVYVQYCYYNMLIIIPKLHVLCVIFACMVCAIKHEQSHTQALEVYIHNRPFSVFFFWLHGFISVNEVIGNWFFFFDFVEDKPLVRLSGKESLQIDLQLNLETDKSNKIHFCIILHFKQLANLYWKVKYGFKHFLSNQFSQILKYLTVLRRQNEWNCRNYTSKVKILYFSLYKMYQSQGVSPLWVHFFLHIYCIMQLYQLKCNLKITKNHDVSRKMTFFPSRLHYSQIYHLSGRQIFDWERERERERESLCYRVA